MNECRPTSVFSAHWYLIFGVNPGGYVGFFNPATGEHETFSMKADRVAAKRLKIKSRAKGARRAIRYRRFAAGQ